MANYGFTFSIGECYMIIAQTLLALFCELIFNSIVLAQVSVVEPGFEIISTFDVPAGLTSSLGTMLFSNDGNTAYILDESEESDSAVWSATVTRNARGDVTGFGSFTQVFAFSNMDTGLELGPGTGTFFFAIEEGGIGQRLTSGTVETTAVSPYDDEYGGLAFIFASWVSGALPDHQQATLS
ncbi:MAG: hypothetical protein ACI8QT_000937 [Halioglobus sp.]